LDQGRAVTGREVLVSSLGSPLGGCLLNGGLLTKQNNHHSSSSFSDLSVVLIIAIQIETDFAKLY